MPEVGVLDVVWAGRDYAKLAAEGHYRPEWTWVALRDDQVVARASWWGGPDDDTPRTLDLLDFSADPEDGAALLRAAPYRCEYSIVVHPGWREQPDLRRATELRIAAAEAAGMRRLVERLLYTWTPAGGLPDRPGRLRYRPVPDDDAVADVLRRIGQGSLDAHTRRNVAELGAEAAAQEELAFLKWLPSPREWWRLAYTPAGELAGITVPGANYNGPVIGFIGVVPEQRGHGYAYDLLVEATHMLVEEGAEEILASTDTTNTPMAAAFARAGYPVAQERIDLDYPRTDPLPESKNS
jgi:RimJ/RimL family protein N-acetyltransferase